MNVYDFDETIYNGDSTKDFLKFLIKKNKKALIYLPNIGFSFTKYILSLNSKENVKESVYQIFSLFDDINKEVIEFWDINQNKIKPFYLKQMKNDDLIISASPQFLLEELCTRLNVNIIASLVDVKTGKCLSKNCYGDNKVVRFKLLFPNDKINVFYSDSFSDQPIADISEKSFIVKKDDIYPWNEYEESKKDKIIKMFFSKDFIMFLIIGVINTFNGTFFALIFSSWVNENFAFVIGYLISLSIGYLLNSIIIFKNKLNIKKFIKYCISYIPNFIVQYIVVYILFNVLGWYKLFAYATAAIIGIPITFLLLKLFAFSKKED